MKDFNEIGKFLHDGNQNVYKIIDFKYPNESNFHSPPENLVIGNLFGSTSIKKLIID